MTQGIFVTGTDTNVGKTLIATNLINALNAAGETAIGYKPVASGTVIRGGQTVNEDAWALMRVSTPSPPYAKVNPFCFQEPIAPHIASQHDHRKIQLAALVEGYQYLAQNYTPDWIIVEGAGGWRVPYNHHHSQIDLVNALNLPVLLVVGMQLGCLNHATLSWEVLKQDQVLMLGWVANLIQPSMLALDENLLSLEHMLGQPPLWVMPHQPQ